MSISFRDADGDERVIDIVELDQRVDNLESQVKVAMAGIEFVKVAMQELMNKLDKAMKEYEARD